MSAQFDLAAHPEFAQLWEQVAPHTMTSPERGFALYQAVNAVIDNDIKGSIVECGVWRGGSAMLIALTLMKRGVRRPLYLFDTFEGMTPPSARDVDLHGNSAEDLMAGAKGERVAELVTARADLDLVRANLASTGYNMASVRFVKGDVAETLPKTSTLRIALLRLDTDFYDSTYAELMHLYPRLSPHGPFIIDDFGHWQGARQAFEDYFADPTHGYTRPVTWRFDYTGYGGVKMQDRCAAAIERYDYVSEGFESPQLLKHFPTATIFNPWQVKWPYLRCEVPHIWRYDTREDKSYRTGYASVEEASCLYTLARQFAGKRGLEIGSHFGWTAAHLLSAGLHLDCVDPEFATAGQRRDVERMLSAIPTTGSYRLWAGRSPEKLPEVFSSQSAPYSFAFIDGNHDGDAPSEDAKAVMPLLADDAVVVFHDLTSPHVERGLDVYRQAGFRTQLFNTMQILGVAWRGSVSIPEHRQDPNTLPVSDQHLRKYAHQRSPDVIEFS